MNYIQNVLWIREALHDSTPEELKKKDRPYIRRDSHGRFKKYMNTFRVSDFVIDFCIGLYIAFLIALYFIARYV